MSAFDIAEQATPLLAITNPTLFGAEGLYASDPVGQACEIITRIQRDLIRDDKVDYSLRAGLLVQKLRWTEDPDDYIIEVYVRVGEL